MRWRGHLTDPPAGMVRQIHGKMGCNLGNFAQGLECRQPRYREVRAFGQLFRDLRELADPAQYGFWRLLSHSPFRLAIREPECIVRNDLLVYTPTDYIQVTQGKVYTSTVPLTRNNHPIEIIQKRRSE